MHGIGGVLLGLMVLLALVGVLLPAANRFRFPYSLALVLVGVGLGAMGEEVSGAAGLIGELLHALRAFQIPSEAFLYLFLPVLLFETALLVDIRRMMEDLGPILLLAVVAVLLSAFAVGFALNAVSSIGLVTCLLLAAIVATTDPVAVVAIFRDLGAPHRLGLLVEGESLFNDAAAIAMFSLLVGMLTSGREANLLEASGSFLWGFGGGLAVGYLAGRIACAILDFIHELKVAEVTITVALAYLSFILGEHTLHVSGVVSVVAAALVMGYEGRTRVSPGSWNSLIDTWTQLGFWASSLIFILAFLRIPALLTDFTGEEFLLLAVLVVSALAARALVLFVLLPLLGWLRWAEHVHFHFRLVVWWGGLRGAISLALALAVVENPAIPAASKHFVAVLTAAFVLFTLFVNAPTLQVLIRMLGLDRLSPADLAMRQRVMQSSLAAVQGRLKEAAADYRIDAEAREEALARQDEHLVRLEREFSDAPVLNDRERLYVGLATLAQREQFLYLRHFRERIVSGAIVRILLTQVGRLQDGVKTAQVEGYVQAARRNLEMPGAFRPAILLHRALGIERRLAGLIADRIEMLFITRAVLHELLRFNGRKSITLLGATTAEKLRLILEQREREVELALDALRLQYGAFSKAVQVQYLERAALRLEEGEYRRLHAEGVLSTEVFHDLERDLHPRQRMLARRPHLELGLTPSELVARVPLFQGLEPVRLMEVTRLLKPRLAVPGERVVRRGERGHAMFFIVSGAVLVDVQPESARLGTGDFFGEIALLTRGYRMADITALGYCQLLVLSAGVFDAFCRSHPEMEERIRAVGRERLGVPEEVAG